MLLSSIYLFPLPFFHPLFHHYGHPTIHIIPLIFNHFDHSIFLLFVFPSFFPRLIYICTLPSSHFSCLSLILVTYYTTSFYLSFFFPFILTSFILLHLIFLSSSFPPRALVIYSCVCFLFLNFSY